MARACLSALREEVEDITRGADEMTKNLQAYKLGVVIDAQGAKALQTMRELDRQAAKTAGSLSGVKSSASSAFSHISEIAAGNAASALLGKWRVMDTVTRAGVDYNKQIEAASVAFEQLTGSAQKAGEHIEGLQKLALKTPFEFEDVAQASLKLQAFGYSAEEVIKILPNLSDAASVAAAGTGNFKGSIDGVTLALGQMRAKGRVSLEEIN